MAISLSKGQKIDLTKGNPELNELIVGLGWDPQESKGFLGFGGGSSIDCDASVIVLGENDKLVDTVYYGSLKSKDGAVKHSGDNLTGDGDGDDEQIMVNLGNVSESVQKLIFVVNIYQAHARKQDFGKVKNAYIRIVNKKNNEELVRFNLTDDYQGLTSLITGELYRHNGEWKFNAIGNGTTDGSLGDLQKRYR